MEQLVILDYSTASVHFYKVSPDADIDEQYLHNLGYDTNMCSWMFGEDLEVISHKGILT